MQENLIYVCLFLAVDNTCYFTANLDEFALHTFLSVLITASSEDDAFKHVLEHVSCLTESVLISADTPSNHVNFGKEQYLDWFSRYLSQTDK